MKTTKILSISLLLLSSSSFAADDVSVKLLGAFDFQSGYFSSDAPSYNENDPSAKPNYISNNQKNLAFATSASCGLEIKNILDNGFIYGAKIGLDTTTKSSRKFRSGIFTESEAGRLELGSDSSAMTKMRISAYTVTAATEGSWDVWVSGDPVSYKNPDGTKVEIPYVTSFTNFLDAKFRASGKVEYSRKITYYTPEIWGVQLGLSYIPDSSNVGYAAIKDDIKYAPSGSPYYFRIKNGFAGGVTYKQPIGDQIKIQLSAVGEMGRVHAIPRSSATPSAKKSVKHLENYTLGTRVDYDQFSFSASYGNYIKSLTLDNDKARHTEIYGAGMSYKFGKLKASIAGVSSKHRQSNVDSATIAFDYKLAPGLMPYAEATYFNFRGKYLTNPNSKKWVTKEEYLLLELK